MRLYTIRLLALLFMISAIACEEDNATPSTDDDDKLSTELKDIGLNDLPVFIIQTNGADIPNEPKIPADYQIKEQGEISQSGRIGIELRGSTSQSLFEKKSYGVETWDENNEDMDVSLLGFPAEEDWILNGPYADKTLLRNVLMYDLSNQIGRYASRTRFVELYLNDEYNGVYVFMEKLKRDKERIDIKKLDREDLDEESITGGYILKIDKTAGDSENGDASYTEDIGFRSNYGSDGRLLNYGAFGGKQSEETYFLYEYPDTDDIAPDQKEYIQNYIRNFELALLNTDVNDLNAPRLYEEYINMNSFADFFILNELSANPDAYRISTFMYKDRGEKLKMGPIWDFNIALGMSNRSGSKNWIYQYNERNPNDLWLVHFWWEKLLADPLFRAKIKSRWQDYRMNVLSENNILATISDRQAILTRNNAIERNFKRWDVLGVSLPFNDFVGEDYESEIDYVKNWMRQRLSWMDGEIARW